MSNLSVTAANTVALAFGGIWVVEGLVSFLNPARTQKFDLGESTSAQQKSTENPWIPLTHARTGTIGLIVLHLGYFDQDWKAVGTMFSYGMLVGLADAWMAWKYTGRGEGIKHLIPTGVLGALGLHLMWRR